MKSMAIVGVLSVGLLLGGAGQFAFAQKGGGAGAWREKIRQRVQELKQQQQPSGAIQERIRERLQSGQGEQGTFGEKLRERFQQRQQNGEGGPAAWREKLKARQGGQAGAEGESSP